MRIAGALLVGTSLVSLAFPSTAEAGTIVQDCAPATVVAAATGARRMLLERAQAFHDWAPDYQQDQCMNFSTGAVMPRTGACAAPTWWRTDCSGFVSCVWSLTESLDTRDFGHGASLGGGTWVEKAWDDLEPGDAVNLPGNHIALFTGWLDAARSSFCVLEEIHVAYTDAWGGLGCIADARDTSVSKAQGFAPLGLVGIDHDPSDGGSGGTGDASSSLDAAADGAAGDASVDSGLAWGRGTHGPRDGRTARGVRLARTDLAWLTLPVGSLLFLRRRRSSSCVAGALPPASLALFLLRRWRSSSCVAGAPAPRRP